MIIIIIIKCLSLLGTLYDVEAIRWHKVPQRYIMLDIAYHYSIIIYNLKKVIIFQKAQLVLQ